MNHAGLICISLALALDLERHIGLEPVPAHFTATFPALSIGMDLVFFHHSMHTDAALLHSLNSL